MTFRIRKKRSNIERQSRDADYLRLVANPTDLAITRYLTTSIGMSKPTLDDIVTTRYNIGLVESSKDSLKSSKLRSIMLAWSSSDTEEYSNLVAELENELCDSNHEKAG